MWSDEALVVEDEKIYTSIMACVMNVMPKVVDLHVTATSMKVAFGTWRRHTTIPPHRYMSSRT